jgi:predicted 3-demethylubiquinone-9 3-methyltransferase (glyoxalase superfamily)
VAGGTAAQRGWLTDKFGVSWQIVPVQLAALVGDPNPDKAARAMHAMFKMSKVIIADLQRAFDAD